MAVAKFGGRNWTVVSALLLLIPTTYIAIILKPGVSMSPLLIGVALAGVGGGTSRRRWPTSTRSTRSD